MANGYKLDIFYRGVPLSLMPFRLLTPIKYSLSTIPLRQLLLSLQNWSFSFSAYFFKLSIQRTQTPPPLWTLTLRCDLDLTSTARRLMALYVAYCIVPWYQVWCLWVWYFTRYDYFFIFVTFDLHLWPASSVMYLMLLYVGTKYEVCRFSRIWDMDNCLEETLMTSRHKTSSPIRSI